MYQNVLLVLEDLCRGVSEIQDSVVLGSGFIHKTNQVVDLWSETHDDYDDGYNDDDDDMIMMVMMMMMMITSRALIYYLISRFYMALFSALGKTHCTLVACVSE